MPSREFLRRRNALWQQCRLLAPSSAAFEVALRELAALTGWERDRLLAGLGLQDAQAPTQEPR